MNTETAIAVVSVVTAMITGTIASMLGYFNYKRNTLNDQKKEQYKDQTDVVTLVKESMHALDEKLSEIKEDIKEIKDDLKANELSVSKQEEQIKTLFKNYEELKREVNEIGKEIRQIRG